MLYIYRCSKRFLKAINSLRPTPESPPNVIVRTKATHQLARKLETWESVVGLEVHAQIIAKSKLFSGAGTSFSGSVNNQVSHFDASFPGTLPVLNRRCVEAALLTALALNCKINKISTFDRKHYFYADLPAGYQITQQRLPLAQDGKLDYLVFAASNPYRWSSRVIQLQLEQDSGKSLHNEFENKSLIDLNRAGVGLMEIVFDCDLRNGEEAAALVEELKLLLQCLGTCDGKMEEGSLRVDANVSINKRGEPKGVRTEVKNIGSIRAVAKAVDFEIERQIKIRESGGVVKNETRMFDNKLRKTIAMRDKEKQQDYRFMPEPNLLPLRIAGEGENIPGAVSIPTVLAKLSELPDAKRNRIAEKYELSLQDAHNLIREEGLLDCFEIIVSSGVNRKPKHVSNLIVTDLFTVLNQHNVPFSLNCISVEKLGELLDLYVERKISYRNKMKILSMIMLGDTGNLTTIIESNNWVQINDESELTRICEGILANNEKLVTKYKSGKTKILNHFMGLVRKATDDRANMSVVDKILLKLLSK